MKKNIALACTVAALAGCAIPPAVIPQQGGSYKTIAYGSSQRAALDIALAAAGEKCTSLKQRFEVSSQEDEYLASLPETVNKVANALLLLDSSEDYRVTLTFACV